MGKDYLGGFVVPIEDIFANGETVQQVSSRANTSIVVFADFRQPHWYRLESRRRSVSSKKKGTMVSGEVQMQFTVLDNSNPSAEPFDVLKRLAAVIGLDADDDEDDEDLSRLDSQDLLDEAEDDEDEIGLNTSDETDDLSKPDKVETKKRKLRMKRLRSKTISRAYEFAGGSDVTGIVFLEIKKIVDLPPERNSASAQCSLKVNPADC